jgi:hypothetical protein
LVGGTLNSELINRPGLSFALLQITESEGADEVLLTKQIDNETCVVLTFSLRAESRQNLD